MIRTLHGVGVWWRIQWIQMVQRSNISQNTFTAAGVERGKSSPVLQTEHLSWHVDQHFLCQLYSYTFQTLKKWSNMKTIHRNTSDILSSTKLRELNTNQQGQLIVGARTDILGATGSEPNTHTHTAPHWPTHEHTHCLWRQLHTSRFGLTYRGLVEDFTRGFGRQDAGRVQARRLKEERQELVRD